MEHLDKSNLRLLKSNRTTTGRIQQTDGMIRRPTFPNRLESDKISEMKRQFNKIGAQHEQRRQRPHGDDIALVGNEETSQVILPKAVFRGNQTRSDSARLGVVPFGPTECVFDSRFETISTTAPAHSRDETEGDLASAGFGEPLKMKGASIASAQRTQVPERISDESDVAKVPSCASWTSIVWKCKYCSTECIPVRRESRCLCGHRLKEHKQLNGPTDDKFACSTRGCQCSHFFFIVAEGAWTLKCRCKHKGPEHDCAAAPFACKKCSRGGCRGFDSPWVCNCGHAWGDHAQATVQRSAADAPDAQLQDVYQPALRTFAVRQDGLLARELEADALRAEDADR